MVVIVIYDCLPDDTGLMDGSKCKDVTVLFKQVFIYECSLITLEV